MIAMIQYERRHRTRRISDDCTQCEIWTLKISEIEEAIKQNREEMRQATDILHQRINKSLPWRIFLIIVSLYFGLATYNALQIKSLSVDTGKLATKIDAVNEKITDLKRSGTK